MKIVIDIPEEDYIRLRDEGMFGNVTTFKRAVREGIPLEEQEPCTDAISRETVAEILNHQRFGISKMLWDIISEKLSELPPVTPVEKQEPCTDAISRKDALFAVRVGILSTATVYGRSEEGMATRREIEGALKALPPVKPAEKVGKWISNAEDDLKISEYTCSNCKGLSDEDSDFCPKCGAKMQEVKNNG